MLESFKSKWTELIVKRENALINYTKCMNPHLERIVDRMQKNKAYVTPEFSQFCVQERVELEYNNQEYVKIKKEMENMNEEIFSQVKKITDQVRNAYETSIKNQMDLKKDLEEKKAE